MNNIKKILIITLLTVINSSLIYSQEEDNVEEVVVISSKIPVPLSEVVGSVTLITQDDLEARVVSDLGDILENTVGVSVPRNSQYGRYYNEGISIRGLGGSRVNIFVDGVRVSDAYAGYGRDVVEVDLLKRVEILKGPTSALYGSDGLAGAVSYVTKDASDFTESGFHYSARYSHFSDSDQEKYSLLSAYVGERVEGILQFTNKNSSEMNLHDDAVQNPNPVRSEGESILGKFTLDLNDNIDITFTLDSQEWTSDIVVLTDIGSTFYPGLSTLSTTSSSVGADEGSRERIGLRVDFKGQNNLFDNGTFNLFSQSTDQQQITNKMVADMVFGQFGPMGPPTPGMLFRDFQFNQSVSGMALELRKSYDNFKGRDVVYGFETETLETERYRNSTLTSLFTGVSSSNVYGTIYPSKTLPNTDTTRTGVYINDRVKIDEFNILSLGLRYDTYELEPNDDALSAVNRVIGYPLAQIEEDEFSVKIGWLSAVTEDINAFFQYAEGFKAPDYDAANLSFNNLAYGYGIVPNANLSPETSKGTEIGFRSDTVNRSWSITRFDNQYEDFIQSTAAGFDFINQIVLFQSQNLNDVDIDGIELSFSRKLSDTLTFSYDLIRIDGKSDGIPLSSISPDQAMIALKHLSVDEKFSANLYLNMVDESFNNFTSGCGRSGGACLTLPDREIFDLYTSYKFNEHLELNVAFKNLSDQKFWDWTTVNGFAADQANLDLWLEPGRNTSVSLKVIF
tara:strand:+ start:3941 stop:6148 length:2208 start_codon:yes stop_codon:yes gene_type:complete